uniref:Ig-like domain-containing protein n=1 Tax=Salarias fasciatus TaxID=181472 RepID=A0A672JTJ3_SALFA
MFPGEARVQTEAQAGPLYRVLGAPLAISCNVSGFRDEASVKHFSFYINKPANPGLDINIISTNDRGFGFAIYQQRVRSGEIFITRVSPNSVIFEIQSLQRGDEGDYDCSVENSEYTYDGSYSVKTAVKVIDDSLSVSSPASTSLSFNEGEALTLTCQASSNTIQHTHLSFAWYLQRDGEDDARPIISLDRDFTLRPGRGFEARYQAGLVRLDKLGEATYRLKVSQLELSDQGKIHCQAQEWIQDPDRSWYPIATKDAEKITLEVKPDALSLAVRILAQHTALQEGQELLLSCSVDTSNLEGSFFSVAFLREGVELARIGPTGVLSVGPEYSGRENQGELRAARTGSRDYRLILRPVRTEDQGEYKCRVWPEERGLDGVFTQGASQDSSSQLVSISATGDRLRLACEVEGVKGRLTVAWQYKSSSTPAALFTNVIGLSQEGVIEETEEFRSRGVRATRPAANVFVFELDEVKLSDSGVYQCAVSEWNTNSKVHSQSQAAAVTVTP